MANWFTIQAKGKAKAEIKIFGDIGYSYRFADFEREFSKLSANAKIDMHISSPGGDVFTGFAIYDRLRRHKGEVTVTVDGLAASMASVIFMAGDKRVMPENAQLMIHNPVGIAEGGVDELKSFANAMENMQSNIVRAYSEASGQDADTIQEMMDKESWLTAEAAVELGFATKVAAPVKMAAHAGFDLSCYKNVPKSLGAIEQEDDEMAEKDLSEDIKRICAFAGKADLADGFIKEKKSIGDVIAKLEELKKAEDDAVAAAAKKAEDSKKTTENEKAVDENAIREKVIAEHADIHALCSLAGMPEKANDFIVARKSKSEVMAALNEAQKKAAEENKGARRGGSAKSEINARHNQMRDDADEGKVLDTSKIWNKFNTAGKTKAA